MKKLVVLAVLAFSCSAFATQQTFTTMGPVDCSQGTPCTQVTTDGTVTLEFAYNNPLSGPTSSGFWVNASSVELSPTPAAAPLGTMDMSILTFTVNSSTNFNGSFYIGSLMLSTLDPVTNTWTDVVAWGVQVGKSKYILLNGYNPSQPLVKGVKRIRLSGLNGTTSFTINMANITVH